MNLRELYHAYGEDTETGARAGQLLVQQHWYSSIAEFDPRTGTALPLGFDTVLRRQATARPRADGAKTTCIRDRLWRIVEHSRASVERIFGSLSESPRREQAILPIRQVKELNATSFIALSRRPGRNVREKLAGRPYMQAVRRYQSVDLPQNRLVKEFVTQLAERLELRKETLHHEDELLGAIYRWLRSDEAQAISRWDNLPPNNTLLSHRDYRRVWDAWRWLQELDDAIDRDFQRIEARRETVKKWAGYGTAYASRKMLFGDMPVFCDYDEFTLTSWCDPILKPAPRVDRTADDDAEVSGAACLDLSYVRPRYAGDDVPPQASLSEAFVWQRWTDEGGNGRESVDLELFRSDAAVLHPDSQRVSCADLFFATDIDESLLDKAAHAFARRLSRTFTDPELVWLVPDFLNDFRLKVLRRNLNSRFPGAEPLPRSVAAVFEWIDYSAIRDDGFQMVVVDTAGGTTYATKLTARHDPDLQERVSETRGFYWERSPHVTIGSDDTARDQLTEIPYIDSDGRWHDAVPVPKPRPADQKALRRHPQIGEFDLCVTLSQSPVSGGLRLHRLQQRAGDIPLWRDQIPELSIKVSNRYRPFYLVSRGTSVRVLRGVPVPIPISDRFTLPAGRPYYEFPLFQGQDPDDLGYVARLESPSFPLSADAMCRLIMTYTYGADDPYRLVFEPLDNSFRPVEAKWRPKIEEAVTDASAPEYPRPATWPELREHRDPGKGKVKDLLDWAISGTEELLGKLRLLEEISYGTINSGWKVNPQGEHYFFATRSYGDDVYINERSLVGEASREVFSEGDNVCFTVENRGRRLHVRYAAKSVASLNHAVSKDINEFIRRSLYVPYIRIGADGRSLEDPECPEWFRRRLNRLLPELAEKLQAANTPRAVRSELRFLFSCLHKDMPESISTQLVTDVRSGRKDDRLLGFALGDLSHPWQQEIFGRLLSKGNRQALKAFALAIWRDEGFVRAFGDTDLAKVARWTLAEIKELNNKPALNKYEIASFTRYCELLLGLLRSRESADPEVRMMLQPHQEITRELAEQVERATAFIVRRSVRLKSRVQIASLPDKPAGEDTPDLLYALGLYLTDDVGANAIRVTGVNEDD